MVKLKRLQHRQHHCQNELVLKPAQAAKHDRQHCIWGKPHMQLAAYLDELMLITSKRQGNGTQQLQSNLMGFGLEVKRALLPLLTQFRWPALSQELLQQASHARY